jgi:hypothetical protein
MIGICQNASSWPGIAAMVAKPLDIRVLLLVLAEVIGAEETRRARVARASSERSGR